MRDRKPALTFIFVTLLLDVLGFGLIIPVSPRLIEHLQLKAGITGGEQAAAPYVGYLMATYSAMQFLLAPLLGTLSDRFGRRPVLLFSMLGSGVDYFAMTLAPTVRWLFITRAVNGATGASMTAATAYIADVTPPEKRAGAYGMVGAAFGLGFILGPLLGGVLGKHDIYWPFYAAGAVTLCNWLYGFFVLPESLPRELRRPVDVSRANPVGAFAGLRRYPFVAWMAVSFFLVNLAQFGLHATWVLYTAKRYNWDAQQVGLSLFTVGLTSAVVQGGLSRKIIPLIGERRALILGLIIGAGTFAAYGLATQGWMIYAIIVAASLGGIGMPAGNALITRSVRADEQGTVQGALTSLQSLASIIGPVLGTQVFAWAIAPENPRHIPGAAFFVGSVLTLLGTVMAAVGVTRLGRPAPVPPAPEAAG